MLIKYLSLHEDVEVHVFTSFDEVPEKFKRVHFHRVRTSFGFAGLNKLTYRIARRAIKKKFFTSNFIYRPIMLERAIRGSVQSLGEQLKKHPVDVLQAEQDIPAATATIVREYTGIPVVTDIYDLWADEEVLSGRIKPGSSAFKAVNDVTQRALQGSDLVLVGNELLKRLLQSKFSIKSSKILISPNGGEVFPFDPSRQRKRRVVYAGNLEPYEYVNLFVEAAAYIVREDETVEISIFGKGPEESSLRKLAKQLGLPSSIFKGFIQREKLLSILSESSVGAVPTKKEYATPIKPFEYLSVGLPAVAIKGMWWANVIEEYHAGKTSRFDAKEFAEVILELLNASDFEQYSVNALKVIENRYNWYKITADLISAYEKLV